MARNGEDVDATFGHHLKNDFTNIYDKLLQSLVQLNGVNTINYHSASPMLWEKSHAC
ncbi:MAG: hypothetical protein J5954_00935 [Prevotella sp.]|nr:hypothetical protein [Prevotella sp.]